MRLKFNGPFPGSLKGALSAAHTVAAGRLKSEPGVTLGLEVAVVKQELQDLSGWPVMGSLRLHFSR